MLIKIPSGAVFHVLNLAFYQWRWIKEQELIEVNFGKRKAVYEVRKFERDRGEVIAVVTPVLEEVEG